MSIRKKILATSIGPVLVLGVITLLFMLTMVKSSLMDEVQDALKGTAAATLAEYRGLSGKYQWRYLEGKLQHIQIGKSGGPDQRKYRNGCDLFLRRSKNHDLGTG